MLLLVLFFLSILLLTQLLILFLAHFPQFFFPISPPHIDRGRYFTVHLCIFGTLSRPTPGIEKFCRRPVVAVVRALKS
jgi:hypothetical protein